MRNYAKNVFCSFLHLGLRGPFQSRVSVARGVAVFGTQCLSPGPLIDQIVLGMCLIFGSAPVV
jgi:hypothetical protein